MPLLNPQTTRLPLETQLSSQPLQEMPDVPTALQDRLLHQMRPKPKS